MPKLIRLDDTDENDQPVDTGQATRSNSAVAPNPANVSGSTPIAPPAPVPAQNAVPTLNARDMQQLRDIRTRRNAVTDAPWTLKGSTTARGWNVFYQQRAGLTNGSPFASISVMADGDQRSLTRAELIENAPNDIATLLDLIDRLLVRENELTNP